MRVVAYAADLYGCGFYRLILAGNVLRAQGHDVVIVPPGPDSASYGVTGDMRGEEMIDAHVPPGTDVVVMQRVSNSRLAQAVPLLRKKGISVVIDVDDDLQHIHPSNPAFAHLHPRTNTGHAWSYCFDACRDASLVTVSTPALLPRYAPHGRGHVLPNCVPGLFLDLPREDSDRVGWGGSLRSHPDDLQVMGNAVRRLGVPFHVVGPADGIADTLGIDADKVNATGTLPINRWPVGLSALGVGLIPLSDTRFNASKSHLKGIEQSALGVPWVASPRAEYRALHARQPGAGILADTPNDWFKAVRALATDPARRCEASDAARELGRQYLVEDHAWRWAEAWERAYATDHATRPLRVPAAPKPARSPLGLPL